MQAKCLSYVGGQCKPSHYIGAWCATLSFTLVASVKAPLTLVVTVNAVVSVNPYYISGQCNPLLH